MSNQRILRFSVFRRDDCEGLEMPWPMFVAEVEAKLADLAPKDRANPTISFEFEGGGYDDRGSASLEVFCVHHETDAEKAERIANERRALEALKVEEAARNERLAQLALKRERATYLRLKKKFDGSRG